MTLTILYGTKIAQNSEQKQLNKNYLQVGFNLRQYFSIVGKRGGLEDTRGTLSHDFARVVDQCSPEAFIFENGLACPITMVVKTG